MSNLHVCFLINVELIENTTIVNSKSIMYSKSIMTRQLLQGLKNIRRNKI